MMDTRPYGVSQPKRPRLSLVPSEPEVVRRRPAHDTTILFIKEIAATSALYALNEMLPVLYYQDEDGYFVLEASDPMLHIVGVSDEPENAVLSFFDHFDHLYREFVETSAEDTHELAQGFRTRMLEIVTARDESHVD